MGKFRGRRAAILAVALLFFGAASLAFAPVNCFEIIRFGTDDALWASPVPSGWAFSTRYIHSLQLSPVEDEYRVVGGTIWQWEERIQSHNAGLPTAAPPRGRFIVRSPWFILQGGVSLGEAIVYRVGRGDLGQNIWMLPPIEAYKRFPGERVVFRSSTRPLWEARMKLFDD